MLYVYHQVVVNVQLITLTLLITMSQAVVVCINNWKWHLYSFILGFLSRGDASIFCHNNPCDCQTCSNIPNAQCVQVLNKFRQCQVKSIINQITVTDQCSSITLETAIKFYIFNFVLICIPLKRLCCFCI